MEVQRSARERKGRYDEVSSRGRTGNGSASVSSYLRGFRVTKPNRITLTSATATLYNFAIRVFSVIRVVQSLLAIPDMPVFDP